MLMELELGMLISKLNPYENTEMYLVPGNPNETKGALQAPQGRMTSEQTALRQSIEETMNKNLQQIKIRVETREREYLAWQFKDLPRLVKRAVRIEYRHLYKTTGLWVTDHLLVGYEGSNGG
jgi:hypothetical protein